MSSFKFPELSTTQARSSLVQRHAGVSPGRVTQLQPPLQATHSYPTQSRANGLSPVVKKEKSTAVRRNVVAPSTLPSESDRTTGNDNNKPTHHQETSEVHRLTE